MSEWPSLSKKISLVIPTMAQHEVFHRKFGLRFQAQKLTVPITCPMSYIYGLCGG